MTNPHNKALEIIDRIMDEEEMTPTETFHFSLDIAKFCIESTLANLAYQIRKNPSDAPYMEAVKEYIESWIEIGIKEGNELFEAELN